MAKVIKIGNGCSLEEMAFAVANLLKTGKVVAVPTDTIYGIAAAAQNSTAMQSIYKIKARDVKKPIAICVGDVCDISKWGKISFPKTLLYNLLPGPVTIVVERQPALNPKLNPGVSLVGIRIPNHPFIQRLCQFCGEPLALTSANISATNSTLAVEEFKDIWPQLDLVVDGGILGQIDPKRLGSTVVDLSLKGCYKIIRPGCYLEKTKEILQQHFLKEV